MNADDDLTKEALDAFARSFDIAPEKMLAQADRLTLEDVRRFLIPKIASLLDRNPEMLMHILYRIDVAERDVKQVFGESPPKDIPAHLADLLIERQLLKLKIRRTYREKGL